jgi:DNA-binding transcriptional MerR regulator
MTGEDASFTTGQVAERLGIAPSTLRYYEEQFAQWLDVPRNTQNQRVYREVHLETLRTIRRLLDEDLYTIEGARRYLARRGRADPLHLETRADTMERLIRALTAVNDGLNAIRAEQRLLARRLATLQRSQLLLLESAQRTLRPAGRPISPAPAPAPQPSLSARLRSARDRLQQAAAEHDRRPPG